MEIAQRLSDLSCPGLFRHCHAPKVINMYFAIRKGNSAKRMNESNRSGLSFRSGSLSTRRSPFR
jgi:hypothetical protein